MQLTSLFYCISLFFIFWLHALGDHSASEPEWFTKLQQACDVQDQKKSDKWCAMLQHCPQDVQKGLLATLTKKRIPITLFGAVIFNDTIESYAAEAASLIGNKRYMQMSLGAILKQHKILFSDNFKDKSFILMLSELHKISIISFYPGWHVVRCIHCIKKACEDTAGSKS